MRVLHLRVGFLILEDLPQLIVLMSYAILVYKDDGLECSKCASRGQLCEEQTGNSNSAIIFRYDNLGGSDSTC